MMTEMMKSNKIIPNKKQMTFPQINFTLLNHFSDDVSTV